MTKDIPATDFTRSRNVLLITATIAPSSQMPSNAIVDPDLRLRQYVAALKSYLQATTLDGVIFCENSAADLGPLKEVALRENPRGIPVDFFTFSPELPPEAGKGLAEMEILDRAFEERLRFLAPDTVVWKVTGRLKVKNLDALVRSMPKDADFYIDMRRLPFVGPRGNISHYADTRIMAYTPEGYRRMLYHFKEFRGYVNEGAIFDHLYPRRREIAPRFRVQPQLAGVDGSWMKDYESASQRAKNSVRAIARKVAPWLWL